MFCLPWNANNPTCADVQLTQDQIIEYDDSDEVHIQMWTATDEEEEEEIMTHDDPSGPFDVGEDASTSAVLLESESTAEILYGFGPEHVRTENGNGKIDRLPSLCTLLIYN